MTESVQEIFIDKIDDPQTSMRSDIDRDGLWELADDIKKNGLINPITVRPVGNRFEVVAGHRRFMSCKIAGKIKISCVVREVDDAAAFGIMASENLVREDVNPVDEAEFIQKVMNTTDQTAEAVAKTLRRSIGYIEDRLAVAMMPDYLKKYLREKQIKLGVALKLIQITDDVKRRMWVDLAVRDGISVRAADYWLYQWRMEQLPGAIASETPPGEIPADEPQPILFECAIDGKKYAISDTLMITIARKNLDLIKALRAELNKDGGDAELSPAKIEVETGGAPR